MRFPDPNGPARGRETTVEGRNRELYRERTGWSWWVHLLVLGAPAGALLGWMVDGDASAVDPVHRAVVLGGVILLVGLLYLFLGGLTVVVYPDRIRVGLGRGWPLGTAIALADIDTLESGEYRPLRDFGGWGLRGSRDRRVWSARGNRAVRLTLSGGRVVYLGSDDPGKLENGIRRAMAVRRSRTETPGTGG